jgi:uncharacterized protein (DUF433 family)
MKGVGMGLTLEALEVPIRINEDGVARVGGTRVPLETLITAFHQGESPEQIVDSFDVLSLADVYAVITYYLNHREEVDEYMREVQEAGERVIRKIEENRPEMFSLRAKLLERLQKQP